MPFKILLVVLIVIWLINNIKMFNDNERGVLVRLGKSYKVVGPGLVFTFGHVDHVIKVDLKNYFKDYKTVTKEEIQEVLMQAHLKNELKEVKYDAKTSWKEQN